MVAIKQDTPPFKVAILRDYHIPTNPRDGTNWAIETLASITSLVHASVPDSSVDIFSPVDGGEFPEWSRYDLLIFTGGTEDLTATVPEERMEAWVRGTLDLIRSVRAETDSDLKLLGLCWGHQAISRALGGKIEPREEGINIDIENIPLNAAGMKFFSVRNDSTKLYKFHKRSVTTPPADFMPLAARHEILLSEDKQILTFQAHPEMTLSIATDLVMNGDQSYLKEKNGDDLDELVQKLDGLQDGVEMWKRIMMWATQSEPIIKT